MECQNTNIILIKNGLIVTQNSKRDIVSSDILIENGIIKKICPSIPSNSDFKVIDAKNKLVLPGLINCHLHSDAYMYKGLGNDLRLFEQFEDVLLNKIWNNETKEQLYIGAIGNYCECIKNGITFVNDYPFSQFFVKELVKAMKLCMIRGSITSYDYLNKEEELDNKTFIKLCEESDIIPLIAVPNEEDIELDKLKTLKMQKSFQKHGHILECKERLKLINDKFKETTINLLDKYDLLNSELQMVHGNQICNKDIEKIKMNNVNFIITPSAELKINDGIYDVAKLLKNNILIGLGTDGAIWNDCTDLFREMKTLILSQKGMYSVKSLNAQKVLDMATIDGAKCFKLDKKIGSIEVGKDADIILIELESFTMSPVITRPKSNIISNLVYCATGNDVTHTIIRGTLLMEDRKLLFINEKEILKNINITAKELMISTNSKEN
jgi:5-methylthioadenosine/S-adenosylhomocysteine deaminase